MSEKLPEWQLEFRALAVAEIRRRLQRILVNREFLTVWKIPPDWKEGQEVALLTEAWVLFPYWSSYEHTNPLKPSLESKWSRMNGAEQSAVAKEFIDSYYRTKHIHQW